MPARQTIQIGHPALKATNKRITDFKDPNLKSLVEDLIDTMREGGLIGIAAPQIAENFTVFVTEPRETKTRSKDQADELRVYINPNLVKHSKEEVVIYEGCGSVLNGQLFGPVSRPKTITIEAFDQDGKRFRFTADGILGRVIQHEYDHLQGIEFLEKVSDYKKLMTVEHYLELVKPDLEHIKASTIMIKKHEFISDDKSEKQ